MLVLLSLALLGANAKIIQAGPKNRTAKAETYWKMWQEFKRVENKTYLTSTHHNERFEIFKDNVDVINRHNSEDHSWKMGVTPFADLTVEEFAEQIVGRNSWAPRTSTERVVLKDTSNVPDSVDWVAQNKVTGVKNQGQCGSCWAFSTTGSVESRYAIAKGQLNELSEQELVDCSASDGNNGCNGGLMDYGFKYVQESGGLCSEAGFPYDAKTEKTKCAAGKRACGQRMDPISGYHDVTANSMDQLMAAVAEGPVSVAIQANQQAFQLYTSGVLSGRCGSRLDHGVLAVGYGTDPKDGKFWKVKNSWGERWGEQGYIRMCRDCDKNRGAGECGILGQPSYPTIAN